MSKKQFIQVAMAVAGDLIWKAEKPLSLPEIYEHLVRGHTDNIEPAFITIFKTLSVIEQFESNPVFRRMQEERKLQRLLLTAIEERIYKQSKVTIVCANIPEVHRVQDLYMELVGEAIQARQQLQNQGKGVLADHGDLKVVPFTVSLENSMSFSEQYGVRLLGASFNSKIYFTPGMLEKFFLGRKDWFDHAFEQFSEDKTLSDFVEMTDQVIKTKREREEHETRVRIMQAMKFAVEPVYNIEPVTAADHLGNPKQREI